MYPDKEKVEKGFSWSVALAYRSMLYPAQMLNDVISETGDMQPSDAVEVML
jgi:hypothetical protein